MRCPFEEERRENGVELVCVRLSGEIASETVDVLLRVAQDVPDWLRLDRFRVRG